MPLESARTLSEPYARRNPTSGTVYYNVGTGLATILRHAEAAYFFRTASKLDPSVLNMALPHQPLIKYQENFKDLNMLCHHRTLKRSVVLASSFNGRISTKRQQTRIEAHHPNPNRNRNPNPNPRPDPDLDPNHRRVRHGEKYPYRGFPPDGSRWPCCCIGFLKRICGCVEGV